MSKARLWRAWPCQLADVGRVRDSGCYRRLTVSTDDLPTSLSNPARDALHGAGIRTLEQVARHSERELLRLHGFGPKSIVLLKPALQRRGLDFRLDR